MVTGTVAVMLMLLLAAGVLASDAPFELIDTPVPDVVWEPYNAMNVDEHRTCFLTRI